MNDFIKNLPYEGNDENIMRSNVYSISEIVNYYDSKTFEERF